MANTTTFIVDDKSRKALEELRETINASSNAQVIRRALTLLQMAAKTTSKGGRIVLHEKDGREREVVLG